MGEPEIDDVIQATLKKRSEEWTIFCGSVDGHAAEPSQILIVLITADRLGKAIQWVLSPTRREEKW